jgi:hypothetical protein
MSARNFPAVKGRPERKADNITAVCEPTVKKLYESRRLTSLWASTASYRDSFTSFSNRNRNVVKWIRIRKEGVEACSRYCPRIFLEGLRTTPEFESTACSIKLIMNNRLAIIFLVAVVARFYLFRPLKSNCSREFIEGKE